MRKIKKTKAVRDELRSEYKRSDFRELVRCKYVAALREKSNVVVLDPRVAKVFPNSESVNAALLSLAEIASRTASVTRRGGRRSA
jgi:hypothetical protein